MSGEKQRQVTELQAARTTAKVQVALVRLAEASDRARKAVDEAEQLLGQMRQTAPAILRLVDGGDAAEKEVGSAEHFRPGPHWDHERRILRVGDRVVKRYRLPSPNQQAILSAFEEEGWPPLIDDPLSPASDQCPKQRLHDTIKSLNACQEHRLIRFRGDGTGQRVCCELVDQASLKLAADGQRLRRAA